MSKYDRIIKGVSVDVYDILTAFNVTNPATQHAIKKLLMPGQRGAKDTIQDLEEAYKSIFRAIEIEKGNTPQRKPRIYDDAETYSLKGFALPTKQAFTTSDGYYFPENTTAFSREVARPSSNTLEWPRLDPDYPDNGPLGGF